MGQNPSALQACIEAVGNGRPGFAAFPQTPLYQTQWVKRYNLDVRVTPAVVVRPTTAEDVAGVVKCAATNGFKVQARSGGHSYGNYGLGGDDGAVAIDMVHMQKFVMDKTTWQATIGAGSLLGEVDKKLHAAGGRAFAHGVCPGVGMGGHCTIGGLGPMSRMWGTCLDHIVEVEVVTADGKIQRASPEKNSDLFFALRGAGAGFGIITEFVMRTHPEPGQVVQYEYNLKFGKQADAAALYSKWQALIADPKLDPRFGSMFIMFPLGAVITGTFYGTQEEFHATGIPNALPNTGEPGRLLLGDYLGSIAHNAEKEALYLSNLAAPFTSKSLFFKRDQLLGPEAVKNLFTWVDKAHKGTLLWFIIFSAEGGVIEEIPTNSTAYAHRDKVMHYESYGVGFPLLQTTRDFISDFHKQVLSLAPKAFGTYPGYVDNSLAEPQKQYWDANLPALQNIKKIWDPVDLFHNPGSVRPAIQN
ncbi:hypothetical protein QBC42DRAFT_230102 [Cladorrhinum samala]|uniref:FAD-binding PCMH-type domain-containing protein n=1 Tax=Cladorrhinum samala TaxID=585594 RepID=A0AAV9HJW6_9PEZI|nr:hypothetical protein QBC42DRAFT_230102 [Cladorrhinum samala]